MSTIVRSLCMLFSVILSTEIIPSKAVENKCGTVSLRTEKVVENGTVRIEYRPSRYVMKYNNSFSFVRKWLHSGGGKNKILTFDSGSYKEKIEQHNKYVLTIYRFNVSMNGRYRVYCGSSLRDSFTDPVTVNLSEPPSVPVIIGLQDMENCRHCIVGEDNKVIALACELHGGTRPLTVTMTIGNESYIPQEFNSTTYIVLFTVRNYHHMENVILSVMNDALLSPLNVTAQIFVIIPPTYVMLEVKVDEDSVSQMYATCTVYGSNPVCNVQFKATSGIIGSEKSSENVHLPHGAWNSVYEVNLNVSEEDNGKDVTCIVECDEFPVDLTDTVKILLPFPPVIKFNISGSILNISEGERAHVKCEAESVPASNISWIEELNNEKIRKKQCDLSPNCVLNIDTDEVSNRRFMCRVHYKTNVDHKYLTVHIIANPDGRETDDYMSKTGTKETCVSLGAVVGSFIGVLAVGILIGVICTFFILTRKGIIAGSKTQPSVSHDIELTGPPTALDTYEQLQNRTDTEIRGTYDSLEVNSRVQQNSQSQYESLNQDAVQYHTYTDLKQSR